MEDPPGVVASTAVTPKSWSALPAAPALRVIGTTSDAAVSCVFVAASYFHVAQSSAPYSVTGALTVRASLNGDAPAHAYTVAPFDTATVNVLSGFSFVPAAVSSPVTETNTPHESSTAAAVFEGSQIGAPELDDELLEVDIVLDVLANDPDAVLERELELPEPPVPGRGQVSDSVQSFV